MSVRQLIERHAIAVAIGLLALAVTYNAAAHRYSSQHTIGALITKTDHLTGRVTVCNVRSGVPKCHDQAEQNPFDALPDLAPQSQAARIVDSADKARAAEANAEARAEHERRP